MSATGKRNLLIALALAAVVVGVVAAILTSNGDSRGPLFGSAHAHSGLGAVGTPSEIAAAASYLGINGTHLRSELRTGRTLAQIAAATSGRSANGLIDALVRARARALTNAAVAGKRAGAPATARQKRQLAGLLKRVRTQIYRLPGYAGLPASARYLGIGTAQLRAQLQSGRSLAQIADGTHGRSAAGLIAARVSTREAALAAALAAGRITKATETALRSHLRGRIVEEVDRRPVAHP